MRFNDIFTAKALAYRIAEDPSNKIPYMGEAFFPTRKKMGVDLKWIKARNGLGVTLKPSTYDALATIRPREGFTIVSQEMPLFRESMKVSEQDMMEIQRAQDSNDPFINDVIDHVFDDVNNLVTGARIAAERMRMSLIAPTSGDLKISIGLQDNTLYAYNYDDTNATWKKNNYEALSGISTWEATNKTTSAPLNDIQDGVEQLAANGFVARYILMNTATLNQLLTSDQIKNALITITGQKVEYLDKASAKEVIERKTGLQVLIYDKKYKDYDGTQKKFYPDDYVSIIADGTLGNTWMGVTPEERTLLGDSKVDVSVLDSGIAVAIQNIYGPPVRHETTVSQIALPSFEGMDGLYVIKVK